MKLLWPSNPIGLGHATRDIALAQALLEKHPDLDIVFVSGEGGAEMFRSAGFKARADLKPLPYFEKDGVVSKHTAWFLLYYRQYKKTKKTMARVIAEEKPDAVISDEELATVPVAKARGLPVLMVTDITGAHFAEKGLRKRLETRLNKGMWDVLCLCDRVVIPERAEEFDDPRPPNSVLTGPVVRSTKRSRQEIRDEAGFKGPTVLACGGGSEHGSFLLRRAVEAVGRLWDGKSWPSLHVVRGPRVKELNSKAAWLTEHRFVPNLHEWVFAADCVVTTAGKSTIDEARFYGTPFIAIPIKNHFEQEPAAKRLGTRYEDSEPGRLADLIRKRLEEPRGYPSGDPVGESPRIFSDFIDAVKSAPGRAVPAGSTSKSV
jgi:UDP-N-acetylglucosamine--N-acetylmuramyl-(pentapeptide) pyrophosphoryl-undecaprenol N-acetylglucosamine transferase